MTNDHCTHCSSTPEACQCQFALDFFKENSALVLRLIEEGQITLFSLWRAQS